MSYGGVIKFVNNWDRIKNVIAGAENIVVTTHVYPDGDSIGSSVAFLNLLGKMKKKAVSINPASVPQTYRFLDRGENLLVYSEQHRAIISKADAIFILDTSSNDRLGPLWEMVSRSGVRRVCIDHHPDNSVEADLKLVDPGACSTAQLIYELYRSTGAEIDKSTAEALYTGIHTDTVSFNFLGTDARTHEIAAHLLRIGVDPKKTWLKIYGNDTPELLKLTGIALSGLSTTDDGRIAWLTVKRDQWEKLGVSPWGTEALTRYPLTIKGVKVIAVFCEEGENRVRVNLRALDDTDVGLIVKSFGGGGHRTSAGATINKPLELVVKEVIGTLQAK